jgi:DNA-binding transcriptional ArsR family regulator
LNELIELRACRLFGALSHPTRLRIAERLVASPASVNEISQVIGISQSNTSQHLAIMLRAGLIVVERRGTTRNYAVRGPRIGQMLKLIEEFCSIHRLHGESDLFGETQQWLNES